MNRRAPFVAGCVTLIAALATMTPDLVGVYFDDAIYVLLAQSLAEGKGYIYPHIPGSLPGIHYPPVWPAVLAAVWKVTPEFPGNLPYFKLLNPLWLGLAAAGATVAGQRILGLPWWGAMGAAIVGTASVPVLMLTNPLLSEPLFLALLFPTLLASERALAGADRRALVIAALLAGVLVLERTIGGVVVIAITLWLLRARRWPDAVLYAGVVGALIAPWQYFVWKHSPGFPPEIAGSYGPYLAWVTDGYRVGGMPFLQAVLAKNVADAWRVCGAFLTPLITGPVRHAATALAWGCVAAGALSAVLTPGRRVTGLAFLGYLAVVFVWPFQVDRFLWAVWPALLLLAMAGVVAAHRRAVLAAGPRGGHAVLAVAALLATGHVTYNVRGHLRGWATSASGEMSRRSEGIVRHVNAEPRLAGKLIAAEVAPMVALYTGLQVVPVEMLLTEDHVSKKTPQESAQLVAAIDRRFRPDAYVLTAGGRHVEALLQAPLGEGRTLVEITRPGAPVRTFLVESQ